MNKVALIAIAKDEGPYIHEWVYHHLKAGFSPIYIGINRTTDNSELIAEKICEQFSDVHIENIDWIDKEAPEGSHVSLIQRKAYKHFVKKIDNLSVSHALFLDIDEFWFSHNNNDIIDFINENKDFDLASFEWLAQKGEDKPFLPPFKNAIVNKKNQHVKTLSKISTLKKSTAQRIHVPAFKYSKYKKLRHIDHMGNKIACSEEDGKNNQFPLTCSPAHTEGYAVLHRMLRSKEEYSSIVLRGRPNGHKIKSNGRRGFINSSGVSLDIMNEDYYLGLECFIDICNIRNLIYKEREIKLAYYKDRILDMTKDDLINEYPRAILALTGTNGLDFFVGHFRKVVDDQFHIKNFKKLLSKESPYLSEIL